MLIELSELLSVDEKEQDVTADIEMQRFTSKMSDYEITDRIPLNVKIRNIGKRKLALETVIQISLKIPCDRCLEDVKYDMNIEVNKEIDMNESENDGVELTDEQSYIENQVLDTEKLVYNEILVHLPMKVLCSENCKGICNRCGTNLNHGSCGCDTTELDPRMAKALEVFNSFKEV